MKNASESAAFRDGYDLAIYGFDNGLFYALHIPAIICSAASLICATIAMVIAFRRHRYRSFFKWTSCDRFIVYLALCDGCLNIPHGADHVQVVATRNHIYPRLLCEFYGFSASVFSASQNILVGLIAMNIFSTMYFHMKLKFGRFDWILLSVTYGIPFGGGIAAWFLGYLGPNGVICLTDGVNGTTMFSLFFTAPLLVILAMNSVLYVLTWLKISSEIRKIRKNMGQDPPSRKAARQAAKSMSLFVAAFFIQWWSTGLYGAWGLFDKVPEVLLHFCTLFPNIGGVLNLCVFYLIKRKRMNRGKSKALNTSSLTDVRKQDSVCETVVK